MKIMAFFLSVAAFFGVQTKNKTEKPFILDGPGMVYIDSEYRTVYANCLPFEDVRGEPYLAIAYLGSGSAGEANKDVYINKIFADLSGDDIENIRTFEFPGDDWYLVIPKYRESVDLKKGDEFLKAAYMGEAFVLKCNSDITVSCFNVTEINYTPDADENGILKNTDENVWNITNIDEILNQ